ncbi:hypothetical protein CLU79DRAFT_774301 [Phycomyces nitens]|nr:hypothetical protein CLU79DRAFT_774301 [Phycomyces nitens]
MTSTTESSTSVGDPVQQPSLSPENQEQPPSSASLYVGELDPSVTEAMLFEMFNSLGRVATIRVCRDAVTRRSLGYAYVNFQNLADAEHAIEALNYSLVKGRPCRIMWSQRDPALRKTGSGNIFIKNLDPTIDNKALHDTFSAFGNILSCKIATDESGNSKGYGFVHYETEEAADNAIKHVNGMLLNDQKVFVGRHISRKERQSKMEEIRSQFTNIYVKNLASDVTDQELDALFKQFGNVTSAIVSRDDAGQSRNFGFVNFEKHDDASTAVDALNETEFHGQQLYVSRAQKKTEREEELRRQYEQAKLEKLAKYQGVNLYVKNLDDDVDDSRLQQDFSTYGMITSAKVMRDEKTGISRGFGFVCFSSPDEATKAVTEMNGRMMGSKPIYVALAQRKEVRRSQLEVEIAQRQQMQMINVPQGGPNYMPGAPMFYGPVNPYMHQVQRPVFPQGGPMMGPRRRWGEQGGNPNNGGHPMPQGYMPSHPHARPSRPPRPPRESRQPQQQAPQEAYARAPEAGSDKTATNPSPPPPPPAAAASTPPPNRDNRLTAEALEAVPPNVQKQMLGERLYPFIHQQEPEYSGKITGMLLEMNNAELLVMLQDKQALTSKINEALAVLRQHFASQEAQ